MQCIINPHIHNWKNILVFCTHQKINHTLTSQLVFTQQQTLFYRCQLRCCNYMVYSACMKLENNMIIRDRLLHFLSNITNQHAQAVRNSHRHPPKKHPTCNKTFPHEFCLKQLPHHQTPYQSQTRCSNQYTDHHFIVF